jgi:FkbM family methyltransferase
MLNSKELYSKNGSRKSFIEKCLLFPLNRQLHKKSKKNLLEKRRQLIVFSFDHIAHTINLNGLYEKESLDIFFEWLLFLKVDFSKSTAIDIGANIGNHSLYFSDHFEKVISFEPHPMTYKVLSLNSELSNNITCYNIGLSDSDGIAILEIKKYNIGGSFITDKKINNSEIIRLEKLDSFQDINNIKLIKIDVEGHEYKTILGAQEIIKKNMPIVIFEQQISDFVNGESSSINQLKKMGYQNFAIIQKHPTISIGILNKFLLAPLIGLIFGEKHTIQLVKTIEPKFYEFIVAIPYWLLNKIK